MSFRITLGPWSEQLKYSRPVRLEVFVLEQKVPLEMEWDEMDEISTHAVALDADGNAVGTGRLLPDGYIGRMAVLRPMRGLGIGAALLTALMERARQRGDQAVALHAQIHARRFYERHGFVQEGEEFMEAGIVHVYMRCDLERMK